MKNIEVSWKSVYVKLSFLSIGIISYVLYTLAFQSPNLVEKLYSRSVFYDFNQYLSCVTGMLPFSLAEMLAYAFALFILIYLICMAVKTARAKSRRFFVLIHRMITLLLIVAVILSLFVFTWGLNYARRPLSRLMGLDAHPSSTLELYRLCHYLIGQANSARRSVNQDRSGVFLPVYSKEMTMREVPNVFQRVAHKTGYPIFSGRFGRVKPVIYSTGLSFAGISGFYFPFTGEANVNTHMPDLLFAATCFHEAAHQRGFAREDEANFIAYFICKYSGNPDYIYSGTMLALIHAMQALYNADKSLYGELRQQYSDAVETDLQAYYDYLASFEGPIEEAIETLNHSYIKANRQEHGVKSYGRMVDLLLALCRKESV